MASTASAIVSRVSVMRVGSKPVVPKVRCADAMALMPSTAHVVEQDAAAAIHLHVDEARREQTFDRPPSMPAPRSLSSGQRRDAAVLDDDCVAFEHVRAVEDTRAGERNAHQTVSVTLCRRGGLSGSRPRACAMAFTSG